MEDFLALRDEWHKFRGRSLSLLFYNYFALTFISMFMVIVELNSKTPILWEAILYLPTIILIIWSIYSYLKSRKIASKMKNAILSSPSITDEMCEFQDKMKREWIIMLFILHPIMPIGLLLYLPPKILTLGFCIIILLLGLAPGILDFYNRFRKKPKDEIDDLILQRSGFYAFFNMIFAIGILLLLISFAPNFTHEIILYIDKDPMISLLKIILCIAILSFAFGKAFARRSIYGWDIRSEKAP